MKPGDASANLNTLRAGTSSHLHPILRAVGWYEAEGEANAGCKEIASRYRRAKCLSGGKSSRMSQIRSSSSGNPDARNGCAAQANARAQLIAPSTCPRARRNSLAPQSPVFPEIFSGPTLNAFSCSVSSFSGVGSYQEAIGLSPCLFKDLT